MKIHHFIQNVLRETRGGGVLLINFDGIHWEDKKTCFRTSTDNSMVIIAGRNENTHIKYSLFIQGD
jgi:hypothetical protein